MSAHFMAQSVTALRLLGHICASATASFIWLVGDAVAAGLSLPPPPHAESPRMATANVDKKPKMRSRRDTIIAPLRTATIIARYDWCRERLRGATPAEWRRKRVASGDAAMSGGWSVHAGSSSLV